MTVYGYIRVSTKTQDVARQIAEMNEQGVDKKNLYVDYASGKDFERPKYRELMTKVARGDKIVIDSLDRLGRDYDGLISEWKRLTHVEDVDIQALDMPFMDSEYFGKLGDLGKLVEDMFLGILSWVAEHERLEIQRRQRHGIERAKAEGLYKGRKPTEFPAELIAQAQEALNTKGKTAAARVLGVDKTTVYRMLRDGRLAAA